MIKNYLKVMFAVLAAVMISSVSAQADDLGVSQVSGEITWIDLNLGKLQFQSDKNPTAGEIVEYRISQNDTRVTDPSDKKFLTIADLHPGQHVTIDVIDGKEERIVQKITADPRPAADYQEAYGAIEAINVPMGTITLAGNPRATDAGEHNASYFVFDSQNIVVMQSSSREPVQLTLKPGDVVKIEYVVKDGKQWAQTITLYSPRVTSTTTTVTTTTSQ